MKKMVVWFSCGSASAVAAKMCLAKYAEEYEIAIVRCVIANEHQDNDRFASDCEGWFRAPIINIASHKFRDCWEVWQKERFLVGPKGAPCTRAMKKAVRLEFECDWHPDVQVYGYTAEEVHRAELFRENNPDVEFLTPLITAGLAKSDCLAMIQRAGIELPAMYRLGFNNNNCIGCVKGGAGYWNRVRVHFPDVFKRMAELERDLNATIIRKNKAPLFLDELSPNAGRHVEPVIDCSLFCDSAEAKYLERAI